MPANTDLPGHRRHRRSILTDSAADLRAGALGQRAARPSAKRPWSFRERIDERGIAELIVGWSIAAHMRTELVTDALGMAIIRRQPDKQHDDEQTILHSDHGCQYQYHLVKQLPGCGWPASGRTVVGDGPPSLWDSCGGFLVCGL
jgi:hypothetical protein